MSGLVCHPKLGTFGNVAFDHYIDGFTGIGIDTCGVVHITVGVDAQIAGYLALNTVGFVHLHTELLGIFVPPSILNGPQVVIVIIIPVGARGRGYGSFAPFIITHLLHHIFQHLRKCRIIGIGCQLFIGHRGCCICTFKNGAGCVGEDCFESGGVACKLGCGRCLFEQSGYLLCRIIDLGYCPMGTGITGTIQPTYNIVPTIVAIVIVVHITIAIRAFGL